MANNLSRAGRPSKQSRMWQSCCRVMAVCLVHRISSVEQLAEHLHVSAPTARQRLDMLKQIGILIAPDAHGHFKPHQWHPTQGTPPGINGQSMAKREPRNAPNA